VSILPATRRTEESSMSKQFQRVKELPVSKVFPIKGEKGASEVDSGGRRE